MNRRAILTVVTAAGLAMSLSGCTLADAITPPIVAEIYPTVADADAPDATIAIPDWVPADALNIQIKENQATGESIMQFGQPTPPPAPIGAPCDASMADQQSTMIDTWWPRSIPMDQVVCDGDWHIFVAGGIQYFAWKNATDAEEK
ncbi:hypothetical protein ACEXQB_000255 [Herbiconiux sp. P18]|uniref:hypothetical protein n=1 Tax=Herbiconiux liangxiaofengii TaxID=3342795 RepID=UPI0035BA2DDD